LHLHLQFMPFFAIFYLKQKPWLFLPQ
jgi:hypothetical protein